MIFQRILFLESGYYAKIDNRYYKLKRNKFVELSKHEKINIIDDYDKKKNNEIL